MVIVNFLHCSISRPFILFVVLVLLEQIIASSHLVSKGCSYLVSCLGEIAGCAGMVQSAGSPMIPAVALRFIIIGFLSSTVLFVAGFFVLVWNFSAGSCLEITKIVSCAWVRLLDNVRLMLMRFAIVSLSYIYAHASDCSASTVLTWASVSCIWFADAPYPWDASVAFLRIW